MYTKCLHFFVKHFLFGLNTDKTYKRMCFFLFLVVFFSSFQCVIIGISKTVFVFSFTYPGECFELYVD